MKDTVPFAKEIAAFPASLRKLIEAELRAGNQIVEISSTFPAPPAGAFVKLGKPVSTRARKSWRGVDFYDRNSSSYSGEFTDSKRFYFVLEPPHPPEPEPNMNDIRDAMEVRQRAADAARYAKAVHEQGKHRSKRPVAAAPAPIPRLITAVERFRQSMSLDYEQWREGAGYDVAILQTATPEELVEIENLILSRATEDWRDVEALAALDSPRARVALRKALNSPNHRVSIAVCKYAAGLISEEERIAVLVSALESAVTYGGLSQALLTIQSFHPSPIIDALLRGVLTRTDGPPVHFAAMLMYLYGKASSPFEWSQRPWFLKFNTNDRAERIQLFEELCAKIGVDPQGLLEKTHPGM